jgi:hypothetical protein
LNILLVGLQMAMTLVAGLIFGSAIAIAISLASASSVAAVAGVLCVRRSIRAVRGHPPVRLGPAVNVSGGIATR